jgi:NAD(P)H-hydrate epimerase
MITAAEMAVVDENAAALGVPRKQLMESSGNAVARVVREHTDPGDGVAVVAGRGNNGGDGMVAARFLPDREVTVHLLGRAETLTTEITRENWDALRRAAADAREVRDSRSLDLGEPALVVDAMLGTGVTGAPREPERTAVEAINDSAATVVSVDVPSGVDADTGERAGAAVDADHVVTFHDAKPGLERLGAAVTVATIGIPETAELFVERGDLRRLERAPTAHKGDHGQVLVVGGGPYTGAPALAARAALRAGADLAHVLAPATVAREIQGYSPDLIVHEFSGERLTREAADRAATLAEEADALVLGPGLGDHRETLAAVEDLLLSTTGVCVLDADALRVVGDSGRAEDLSLICTPHAGEFRRMGGAPPPADDWRGRMDAVAARADDLDCTILLKGPYDVISDGERTRVNRSGTPAMTVGGTGDVLAGATGAVACRLNPVEAAAVAARANGLAGEAAVEGRATITATDLLETLPGAMSP